MNVVNERKQEMYSTNGGRTIQSCYSQLWEAIQKSNNSNSEINFKEFKGIDEEDCLEYIYGSVRKCALKIYEIINSDMGNSGLNKKKPSYKYLFAIRNACGMFYMINRKSGIKKGIKKCEDLKEAFEKAFRFSGSGDAFLSYNKVKNYMGLQTRILKTSIARIKVLLKAFEKKGTKNPIKNIYKKFKAEDFLNDIGDVNFPEFTNPTDLKEDNIVSIYGDYNGRVGNVANMLEEAIVRELSKSRYNGKRENDPKTSKKYLVEIKDACQNIIDYIITCRNGLNKEISNVTSYEEFEKLQEKLAAAAAFSDPHETSLLSQKKVKSYMIKQAKTLKKSIKNLASGLEKVKAESKILREMEREERERQR